ncbi:MAG: hypothetical protein QNK37_25220 [Acidobacteriota bacterium]|nr:hypothetical protein [Acidobacteriota bacterium]
MLRSMFVIALTAFLAMAIHQLQAADSKTTKLTANPGVSVGTTDDPEVCDKSLGGWDTARDAANSKAAQACADQGCSGVKITGGRYYRDGEWYVHCVTYQCTGCGGVVISNETITFQ